MRADVDKKNTLKLHEVIDESGVKIPAKLYDSFKNADLDVSTMPHAMMVFSEALKAMSSKLGEESLKDMKPKKFLKKLGVELRKIHKESNAVKANVLNQNFHHITQDLFLLVPEIPIDDYENGEGKHSKAPARLKRLISEMQNKLDAKYEIGSIMILETSFPYAASNIRELKTISNARTGADNGAMLRISAGMLELLDDEELKALIGHELYDLEYHIAHPYSTNIDYIGAAYGFTGMSQKREMNADLHGAKVNGNHIPMATALMNISHMRNKFLTFIKEFDDSVKKCLGQNANKENSIAARLSEGILL